MTAVIDGQPETEAPAAPPARTDEQTVFQRYLRWLVAICSAAAGLLHLEAMIQHQDHHPTVGRAFLAVGVMQILWAALVLKIQHRWFVALGMAATVGFVVIWILSRTQGIDWFPGLEEVDLIGWRDLLTQGFQLVVITACAALLLPVSAFQVSDEHLEPGPIVLMLVLAVMLIAFVYAATHGYSHEGATRTPEGAVLVSP